MLKSLRSIQTYVRLQSGRLSAPPGVCSSLRRKRNAIGLCEVIDILGSRKAPGDIDLVVVTTQEKIWSEVELLHWAMAFDLGRKCRPQHAPGFVSFLPR